MDRVANTIAHDDVSQPAEGETAFPLEVRAEELILEGKVHAAIPDQLFNLSELDCLYEHDTETLWTYMRPEGRPSFTPGMLRDFVDWQELIGLSFGPGRVPLKYLVLGSRAPGVFCFGGDLELFQRLIREGDREGLTAYGYRCVEILFRNMQNLELPIITVGLVQGAALGGGFEALLSFDFIVAERGATFGLPEILFGLFPGMGAHALLTRKLGSAMADRLIFSNETYTAEQMYDLGIVHQLAEPGAGLAATREFIAKTTRRHGGVLNARRATKMINPITLGELRGIVDLWTESALCLREQDLRVMTRLATAQARLPRAA